MNGSWLRVMSRKPALLMAALVLSIHALGCQAETVSAIAHISGSLMKPACTTNLGSVKEVMFGEVNLERLETYEVLIDMKITCDTGGDTKLKLTLNADSGITSGEIRTTNDAINIRMRWGSRKLPWSTGSTKATTANSDNRIYVSLDHMLGVETKGGDFTATATISIDYD